MSTTVDQRVVEMRFDNQQFEANVKTSISTIEKLKRSLNFSGSAKSLENVEKAANKVNMSGLNKAIDVVHTRFSALEVMGVTALANITNSAVNAGKRIVDALTIDPVKTGFDEYETKIGAIQTIMSNTASKGTTMDDVTKTLDELNTYADKTIYNFAEMTRNIGTFTAAGVGLKESATAIQGIANLAAASGSTSQQASTAMYQLSQALAAGTVKLQDWNSVVNAGMGGEKFQEALKETARRHGIAVDEMIEKNGSFRESLQEGWITADILNETLNNFTVKGATEYAKAMQESGEWTKEQAKAFVEEAQSMEDAATKVKTFTQLWDTMKESVQSGWSQSWEIVIGNFEESKELFTEISDTFGGMIDASSKARNEVLQGWKDLGGRAAVIDAIRNSFKGLMSLVKPVGQAFRETFSPITAKQLVTLSNNLKEFTSHLILSEENADKLRRTFKGLFAVLDLLGYVTGGALKIGLKLLGDLLGMANINLLDITASAGDAVVKFKDWIKTNDVFVEGLKKGIGIIRSGIQWLRDLVDGFLSLPAAQSAISNFKMACSNVFGDIGDYFSEGGKRLNEFIERAQSVKKLDMKSLNALLKDFKDNVLDYFFGIDLNFDEILKTLGDFKDVAGKYLVEAGGKFGWLAERIFDFVSDIRSSFDGLNIPEILTVTLGVGIFAAMVKTAKMIENAISIFTGPVQSFTAVLDNLSGVFKAYSAKIKAEALVSISKAVAILAGSLFVLAQVEPDRLISGGLALTGLAVGLAALAFAVKKIDNGAKISLSIGMMAAAVLILVKAFSELANVNMTLETAFKSVEIIGLIIAGLVGAGILMGKLAPQLSTGSFFLISFAASVKIMVSSLKEIQALDTSNMGKVIGILVASMAGLALVAKSVRGIDLKTAVGVVAMVAGLRLFIGVINTISGMDTSKIVDNMGAFVLVFGSFAVLTKVSKSAGKYSAKAGVGILAMAAALVVMSVAIKALGKINGKELVKGTAVISELLIIFALLTKASKVAGENAAKAGAMLLMMSGALLALTMVITILSKIEPDGLLRAVAAISVLEILFGGLIAATSLAKDCRNNLVVMTVAVTLLASAIGILSTLDPTGVKSASTALSMVIGMFSLLVASSHFAQDTTKTVAVMTLAVGAIAGILYLLSGMDVGSALTTAESISLLLLALSTFVTIISKSDQVSNSAYKALGAMTLALGAVAVILGILEVLDMQPSIETAASLSVLLLSLSAATLILSRSGNLSGAISGVESFIVVVGAVGLLLGAIGALVEKFPQVEEFITSGIPILEAVGRGIGGFVGSLVGGLAEGVMSGLPSIGQSLSDFMENASKFFNGTTKINADTMTGIKSLAEAVMILTATDLVAGISKFFTGGFSLADFGRQLEDFGPSFSRFAASISGEDFDANKVKAASNAAKAIADFASNIPNEGGKIAEWIGDNKLSDFAKELEAFAPSFKKYADEVAGIDSGAVNSSANAAKAVSDFASNIPNQGGKIAEWIGDNKLSDFAKELEAFAPSFKKYADGIEGIDSGAVNASSNAAKAVADFANNIPNQGGKIAEWIGDNKLSDFAKELEAFAPAFKDYAENMKTVGENKKVVDASTYAAQSIAKFAQEIPNSGGVISIFTGNNDMGEFGENLKIFGEAFKDYSGYMEQVKPDVLDATTNAAKSLVSLAQSVSNLPLDSVSQTGALTTFGYDLSSFGGSFKGYYDSISEIDPAKLTDTNSGISGLIDEMRQMGGVNPDNITIFTDALTALGKKEVYSFLSYFNQESLDMFSTGISTLVESIRNMSSIDPGGVNNFKNALSDFSTESISGFVETFKYSAPQAAEAAKHFLNGFLNGITAKKKDVTAAFAEITTASVNSMKKLEKRIDEFMNTYDLAVPRAKQTASALLDTFVDEATNKQNQLTNIFKAISSLAKQVLDEIKKLSVEYGDAGEKTMDRYSTGVVSKAKSLKTAVDVILVNMLEQIRGRYGAFQTSGKATMDNFVSGIKNSANAQSLYNSFYQIGGYVVDGFAAGINANTYKAQAQAAAMASYAAQSARDALGVQSPSKVFRQIGVYVVEGFCDGVIQNKKAIKQVLDDAFLDTIDDVVNDFGFVFGEHLSTFAENANFQDVAKEAIAEMGKAMYTETEEFKNSKKALEQYNEELANLKKQKKELAKKRDASIANDESIKKQIKSIEKEIASVQQMARDQEAAGELIRINAEEETKALEKRKTALEKQLKESKKNTKELKKNLKDVKKDITETNENILSEQKSMAEQSMKMFTDYFDSLSEKVKSSVSMLSVGLDNHIDLFEKFEVDSEIAIEDILKNMQSQVVGVEQWNMDLDKLASRGIATGLLQKLRDMGPEGAGYVQAFLQMTESEFEKANSLYARSAQMTGEALLRNMQQSLASVKNWTANIAELASRGLNKDLIKELEEMGPASAEYVDAFMSMTYDQFQEANRLYAESLTLPDNVASSLISSYLYAGSDAAKGFADGLAKGTPDVLEAAKSMANKALEAVKGILGIASPSKEFLSIGQYVNEGFVKGLKNSYGSVVNEIKQVGDNVLDTMLGVNELLINGIDAEPTIRPVVDLSNVYQGADLLNGEFGANRSFELAASISTQNQNGVNAIAALIDKMDQLSSSENEKVVDAITQVQEDIRLLATAITGMKMVLDSGALVGELASDIDEALGRMQVYAERGI